MDNRAHSYVFQLLPTQQFNLTIYILGAFGPFICKVLETPLGKGCGLGYASRVPMDQMSFPWS